MIVITGATGKTGAKVAEKLLVKGESVRAVGRSAERLESLRKKGAEIAVGDQSDAAFLAKTLVGADALYLLIPPKIDAEDFLAYYHVLTDAAVEAIRKSGVGKIVFLSSLGADRPSGTGPVVGLHDAEEELSTLIGVDIVFLRPSYFMENTLGMMEMIATQSITGGNMPGDISIPMASTEDIADTAVRFLTDRSFTGHSSAEIISDYVSFNDIAMILGDVLGISSLRYMELPDSAMVAAFTGMGFSRSVAESYVELMHAIADGVVQSHGTAAKKPNGSVRFEEFARTVFKPAFEAAAKEHATV